MNRLFDKACVVSYKFGAKTTVSFDGASCSLALDLEGSRSLNVPLRWAVGAETTAVCLGEYVLGDVRIAIANQLQERAVLTGVDHWRRELVLDVSLESIVCCSCCVGRLACQVNGERCTAEEVEEEGKKDASVVQMSQDTISA